MLDVVARSSIGAFPGLSSCPVLPNCRSGKGINSDPMQRRILLARIEKMIHRLMCQLLGNEQLQRPSFQSLPTKADFNGRRAKPRTVHQKVSPRTIVLKALKHESLLVPFDVKTWELFAGRKNGACIPRGTRP